MRTPKVAFRAGSAGFTLVETLVALIVLAVGMLGVAVLYIEGLRAERTSVLHSAAVSLAADMADRIRSNRTAGDAYGEDGVDGGCVNGDVDCDPQTQALNDVLVWKQDVAARLPGGQGSVVVGAGAPTPYTITVSWAEAGQEDPVTYVLDVQI
jgi:type IV pilus assembly protein PilV